ncbi:hypothetical protein O181_089307 [Austropuccinia psidii MF-1]|uniref:Uncharacterized protein n=1 Tax=Austropuccinia psidii MF-1 TaxID=1389203 RepID=A0A9Q3P6I5_9BASI|nr:hypothetical protein [Austropuccinia psidii MF-1]
MCDLIKGGTGRELGSTYTFTPIAFEAVKNPPRLPSGFFPHTCENLWRNKQPTQANCWKEDRRQKLCGGGFPRKKYPAVTGALLSEEGLALSKLGLTYGVLNDMVRKKYT